MPLRIVSTVLVMASLLLLSGCRKADQAQPTPTNSHASPTALEGVLTGQSALKPESTHASLIRAASTASETNAPATGVRLRAKWPVGHRYVYRMDLEQHSTNRLPQIAEPRLEHVFMGVTYALKVSAETSDGGRDLDLEFLAYELEMTVGGQVALKFDSGQAATNSTPDPVAAILRKVIGPKVHLQINPEGTDGKVLGFSEWLKGIAGDGEKPAEQVLVQQFNEGFFKQITDFGKALPKRPVQIGDTWPHRIEVPAGAVGTILAESTITFRRWEERDRQKFAVLESKGTLKGVSASGGVNPISLENGSVSGTSWFDPELGALMESVVEQSMRLRAEPAAPPGGTAPGVFTSEIEQTVMVKLVEVTK